MSDLINSNIVLQLNGNYQRIGWRTVAQAISAMAGGENGSPPYLALDLVYELDNEGKPQLDKLISWELCDLKKWVTLPVRPWDLSIGGVRGKIRVPTVVICPHFKTMKQKKLRPTPRAIRERDGNRCVYTGVELTNKTFSLDHVIPKSKGGKDTWENLASCHKDVNSKKGNKFNDEAGLVLRRKLYAPKSMPMSSLVTGERHPDHVHFPQ